MMPNLHLLFILCNLNFSYGMWSKLKFGHSRVNLHNCLINILTSHFEINSELTIVSNVLEDKEYMSMINNIGNYMIISRQPLADHMNVYNSNYVILINEATEIIFMIDNLIKDLYWNPLAKFIIVMEEVDMKNDVSDKLFFVFNVLLRYRIINVVLINEINHHTIIHTYNPYEHNNCGRKYSEILKVYSYEKVNDTRNNVYKKHLKNYLQNCPLRVATQMFPPFVIVPTKLKDHRALGLEQFITKLISDILKFELKFDDNVEIKFGIVTENYTATGLLAKIEENESDLAIGGLILTENRALLFDYIWIYFTFLDGFRIFILREDFIELWKHVYLPFQPLVWVLLLLVYITHCFIFLLSRKRLRGVFLHDKISIVLYLWGYMLQNEVDRLMCGLKRHFSLVCWIWFIVLMNNFYQTSLVSIITKPISKQPINDLKTLSASGYKPCVPNTTQILLKSANVEIINEDHVDRPGCEGILESFTTILNKKKMYTTSTVMKFISLQFNNSEDYLKLHMIEENLSHMTYGIIFYKGFPWLETFQIQFLRIAEVGLIQKEISDHFFNNKRGFLSKKPTRDVLNVINIHDLRVPFIILALGIIISGFVFVLELFCISHYK